MVRQSKMTEAESCWEDSLENDEARERYLRRQKEEPAVEAAHEEDVEIDESEEETSDESEDELVTAEHEADAGDDDDDDDYEDDEEEDSDEESEDDEPENVAPDEDSATATRGRKMAKTKADGSKTKAESIREVIEAKRKAGAELRPRDIIEALNKRGVEVNASQVSITLRNMGIPPLRSGAGAKKKPAATAPAVNNGEAEKSRALLKRRAPEASAAPSGLAETEKLLDAAADFMHASGGYEHAVKLLNMCNRLSHRD
jgi:hypothetical protein